MKRKLYHILLAIVICCGIFTGCGGKKEEKDVTLIIKLPGLVMNSVSNPNILESVTFFQQAGRENSQLHE